MKATLTLAHLGLALSSCFELIKSVDHSEDLYGTDRIQHVRIVTRSSAKTAAFMLTGQDKVYRLIAWQRFGVPEQVQGHEPPVDAVEPQVLGQPVVVLVLTGVKALDVLDVVGCCELELIGQLVELCNSIR